MSCLSASLTREGGLTAGLTLVPAGMSASLAQAGAIAPAFQKVAGITSGMTKVPVSAAFTLVCDSSIRIPYLDIDPALLWIYPDIESSNDVISNTFWHVN